jgi:cytochrome oxidase assembly protein ShyY1
MSRPGPKDVARLAITPRWLVALLVVVGFAVAAALLGRWQWDRTQSILDAERAAASEAVAVETLFDDAEATEVAASALGHPVTATGRFDPQMQVFVTSREHEGEPGVWVVTGLRLDSGPTVAVLRGWLPSTDSPAAAVPTGPLTVTGVVQPDETFYADAQTEPGAVASIAHDRLASLWDAPLLPGYVTLAAVEPASDSAPTPVAPTLVTGDVAFPLQNFFYAWQWWVFALFGFVVYARWLWLEAKRDADTVAAP